MNEKEIARVYTVFSSTLCETVNTLNAADRFFIAKAVRQVRSELRENANASACSVSYYAAAVAFLNQQRTRRGPALAVAERFVLAYRSAAAELLREEAFAL